MKAIITKASDTNFREEEEIYELGRLFRIMHQYDCELILGTDFYPITDKFGNQSYEEKLNIILYDDYVE